MQAAILGDGALGSAIGQALRRRGDDALTLGRPARAGRHDPADLAGSTVVFDASRGDAVATNVQTALAAGCRRLVVATTGWDDDRPRVDRALRDAGACAVAAANLSLGAALFGRLVEAATELFGPVVDFEPYVVEWHRRDKRDRPSGTALDLAARIVARHPRVQRLPTAGDAGARTSGDARGATGGPRPVDELEIVSIRAGASPGSHLVGFDAAGETLELRLTARDRSAYATGALAAADWLLRAPRTSGLHPIDAVIDELLATRPLAATA